MDRAEIVHRQFLDRVAARRFPDVTASDNLRPDRAAALRMFRSQCISRHLDRTSRAMQAAGQGYYTIGSSGHEGMAAVAAALRPTDIAFLHYRDAAFQVERASQLPGQTPIRDMLLGFACAAEDPISGGRHKVLGSRELMIPPQTSTIASHLPKAVGAAYSLGLARRNPPEHRLLAEDAIVFCSFGDASLNHATAQAALNTAGWTAFQSVPLPLLFVCEDNGIGISVRTPPGWVEQSMSGRTGLTYMAGSALDLFDCHRVATEAVRLVRTRRKPVFLHLRTVRLYGHAGSDLQAAYLTRQEIEQAEADDPLLRSAALLCAAGYAAPQEVLDIYNSVDAQCRRVAAEVVTRPHLCGADQVMASIVPPARACRPAPEPDPERRLRVFGSDAGGLDQKQPMARLINWALTDIMLAHGEVVLAGEDVGAKGGVYGVTQKLRQRFGPDRVIDTLLDEQSILGLAIGMAHNGFIPIPEIQFLAYLHNAEDQLRGEAATLPFFSNGQFANPMVVRIAGLGYQKGFGGHFHNDNSLAVLRDIPGIVIACPSGGADAAGMLRECVRLAREEQRVCVFLEPIALYQTRDLHEEGDGEWMAAYPEPGFRIALGEVGRHGDGSDIAVISFANGCYRARQAAGRLAREKGVAARVIDLRWIAPLPAGALLDAVAGCRRVLVVDECRRTGGQSEAIMTLLAERGISGARRLAAHDSFIPTGPAYADTMPSADSIFAAALEMVAS